MIVFFAACSRPKKQCILLDSLASYGFYSFSFFFLLFTIFSLSSLSPWYYPCTFLLSLVIANNVIQRVYHFSIVPTFMVSSFSFWSIIVLGCPLSPLCERSGSIFAMQDLWFKNDNAQIGAYVQRYSDNFLTTTNTVTKFTKCLITTLQLLNNVPKKKKKLYSSRSLKSYTLQPHKTTPSYFKLLYYLWLRNKRKIYKLSLLLSDKLCNYQIID